MESKCPLGEANPEQPIKQAVAEIIHSGYSADSDKRNSCALCRRAGECADQILALFPQPKLLSDKDKVKIVVSEIREWARIHKVNRVSIETLSEYIVSDLIKAQAQLDNKGEKDVNILDEPLGLGE